MFKEIFESKTPTWDIKSQSWKNADAGYIKAQKDIEKELKELTQKNAAMQADEEWPNRDFDIAYGNKIIVKH